MAVLQKTKSTNLAETIPATLYGIIPKPGESLEDIKYKWVKRTKESYQKISLFHREGTIWRCARNGKAILWDEHKMISNSIKHDSLVVENYVSMGVLPVVDQQKLALERMSLLQGQLISSFRYQSLEKATNSINELIAEIALFPGNVEPKILLELHDGIPSLVNIFGENPLFEQLRDCIDSLRFREINNLVASGEWFENCLLVQKILDENLYRFSYGSFNEYCTHAGIKDSGKRIKLAKLINVLQEEKLKIPDNKQQAYTIADIPLENQARVWKMVIASGKKITCKLIKDTHQSLVVGGRSLKNSTLISPQTLISKIDNILEKYPTIKIGKLAFSFYQEIKSSSNISNAEAKMLESLYSALRVQSKSSLLD